MWGITCKGLHCAGCGKGIPAGIILVVIAIIIGDGQQVSTLLGKALLALSGILVVIGTVIIGCVMITGAAIHQVMRRGFIYQMSKWDAPSYAEQKEMEKWPYRGMDTARTLERGTPIPGRGEGREYEE